MSYYYINRNAQDDGYHEVHNGSVNCPHPPLPENQVGLGNYDNCMQAIAAAKRANPSLLIDGCYWCINPCHTR